MSDLISHQVLSKLGIVCFEYHWDGFFSCMGQSPQWAIELFPCVRNRFPKILPGDISPFLENFIIDAIEFWQQESASILRSGYWSETIPEGIQSAEFAGHDIHLEALVLNIEKKPILLLEVSEMKFFETFHWLQTARKERLDSTLEQKSNATQVMSTAFFDPLTGLPNERSFSLQLSQWLEALRQKKKEDFLLIRLNVDRFRSLNITLGKARGDQYLIQLAQRLKQFSGQENLLARFDADEYVLAIEEQHHNSWSDVLERLQSILQSPYKLGSQTIFTTVCLGIISCDNTERTAEELICDLSIALNQAKSLGRGQQCFFKPELKEARIQKLSIEQELLSAIQQQDFTRKYQPIFEKNTQTPMGLRVVWEWHHPHLEEWSESALDQLVQDNELCQIFQTFCLDQIKRFNQEPFLSIPFTLYVKVNSHTLFSPFVFRKVLALNQKCKNIELILKIQSPHPSLIPEHTSNLEKLKSANIKICFSIEELQEISPLNLWSQALSHISVQQDQISSKAKAQNILSNLESLGLTSQNWDLIVENVSEKINPKAIADLPIALCYGDYLSHPLSQDEFLTVMRSQNNSSNNRKKKSSVD